MLPATPFNGRTARADRAQVRYRVDCARCGSSLARRYQGTRDWHGEIVDWWECGCGRRRLIPRERP